MSSQLRTRVDRGWERGQLEYVRGIEREVFGEKETSSDSEPSTVTEIAQEWMGKRRYSGSQTGESTEKGGGRGEREREKSELKYLSDVRATQSFH